MEKPPVRHQFELKTSKDYFSVVDMIALTTSSKNPQNYWKVLKNRLKKEGNQLVTKINRLKMQARDGKSYLTDAADAETLTEIIKLIPGARVNDLESCFAPFVETPPDLTPPFDKLRAPLSLPRRGDGGEVAELLLDAYEDGENIFIEAFIASVSLSDLNIELTPRKISISGKRIPPSPWEGEGRGEVISQELQWLSFSRTLELPHAVDPERAEAREENGHLIIKLPKIQ